MTCIYCGYTPPERFKDKKVICCSRFKHSILPNHWDKLHRYVYTTPEKAEADYLLWQSSIPNINCNCMKSWLELTTKYPPDFSSAEAFFLWGVDRHNDVNVKLGKPILSIKEAYQIHRPSRTFTRMSDLYEATISLINKLPPIRGVAGIPVSGMLVAPIISSILHVPLYEFSASKGLIQSAFGSRGPTRITDDSLPLLIVDDTISTGKEMGRAWKRTQDDNIQNVIFAVALALPESKHKVNLYGGLCPEPHLLEWNLPNSGYVKLLGHSKLHGPGIICDMDGVICLDPPKQFNESNPTDREQYLNWIINAQPGTFLPRMYEVPIIVSWRCEYTRKHTETWLRKHHIKYNKLILWGDPNDPPEVQAASRTWLPNHKGDVLLSDDYAMIVESCKHQSRQISEYTNKPVLCWDTKEYVQTN